MTTDYSLVKNELERILASKTFKQSYILSNFLRYVVIETIEDNSHEIKEYSIAVKALGKPDNFNPQLDAVVRIHAGRLRRSLHLYYYEEGANDPITISLQKGTYIPEFNLRNGIDHSPENKNVDPAPVSTLLNRVAVIPFKNLSTHSEDDLVLEGFCEHLSSELASLPEISAISYFANSHLRSTAGDIRAAGKQLGANYLITGSIYYDKKHFRVSVQFVSADSGLQLWTKTFERALNSSYIYDVIDSITKEVISKLSGYNGVIVKSIATSNPTDPDNSYKHLDTISCYYHYQIKYTEDIFQRTRMQLENSIKQNPNVALPLAMLAQLYIDGCTLDYLTVNDPVKEAVRYAQRALQLDAECQHAHMSLAWAFVHLQDKEAALKSIRRCIAINPNASFFLASAACMSAFLGDYDLCMKYYEESRGLNSCSSWWLNLGPYLANFYQGEYEAALQYANRINIPGVCWNLIFRIAAHGQMESEESIDLVNQLNMEFPGQAEVACATLKKILFHQEVYRQIKSGLVKAGVPFQKGKKLSLK